MRTILLGVVAAQLVACTVDSDTCDTRELVDIPDEERPEGLTAQAEALNGAVGTWVSSFEDAIVTMTLITEPDAIEVKLGAGNCGGGGGPATSSVQIGVDPAVTDDSGDCNLSTYEPDPAWCEFEADAGSWQVDVADDGAISASLAATLLGGAEDDVGVEIVEWERSD